MKIYNPFKLITSTADPNIGFDDVLVSLGLLLTPWRWGKASSTKYLELSLASKFRYKHAITFERGRQGLYFILKALGVGTNDEVIIQSFTCAALSAPIMWLGAKPVYTDIGYVFNMTPESLSKAITPKTKAVIVQHTFGIPAPIREIQEICKEKNIYLIEDLAHSLGVKDPISGLALGKFGIASFTSFGQDKKISGQGGGAVFIDDTNLASKVIEYRSKLHNNSVVLSIKRLLKTIISHKALQTYHFLSIGKAIIFIFRKLGVLGGEVARFAPLTLDPKSSQREKQDLHTLHPIQARLVLHQLKKFNRAETARIHNTNYYSQNLDAPTKVQDLPLLRYPIIVPAKVRKQIIEDLKKARVQAGTWYSTPVLSSIHTPKMLKYKEGSCPNTEKILQEVLNLPTHLYLDPRDRETIVKIINKHLNQ